MSASAADAKSEKMSLRDFLSNKPSLSIAATIKAADEKCAEAKKLYDERKADDALVKFKEALTIDADNFSAHKWKAVIEKNLDFKQQKKKETDRQPFIDDFKADPVLGEIAYRGYAKFMAEDYEDAVRHLNEVIDNAKAPPSNTITSKRKTASL